MVASNDKKTKRTFWTLTKKVKKWTFVYNRCFISSRAAQGSNREFPVQPAGSPSDEHDRFANQKPRNVRWESIYMCGFTWNDRVEWVRVQLLQKTRPQSQSQDENSRCKIPFGRIE